MTKKYSIAEAKDHFTHLIHQAEAGITVELTRRGRPVAVLLSLADFERLSQSRTPFWEAYQNFRREFALGELDIDPDEVFAEVRDRSAGRGFKW